MKRVGSNEGALIILVAALVALFSVSQVLLLAFLALGFSLWGYRRLRLGKPVKLHRIWLYLGILPFAIWFVAFPNAPGTFSPLFIYIPAWYFLYIAVVEWMCLGRGGRIVFVWFDAFVVLFLSSFEWNVTAAVAFAVALGSFLIDVRSRKSLKLWLFFLALSVLGFAVLSQLILQARAIGRSTRAERYESYYQNRSLMGFSKVGKLGTFGLNYSDRLERSVVFRIYSKRMPVYLKGIAYERYLPGVGLWKQSDRHRFLQTGRFVGDYGGFENGEAVDSNAVWIRSSLALEDALFAPPGAAGVAIQGPDSIPYYAGDFYQMEGNAPRDWYYWDGVRTRDSLAFSDTAWLGVPSSLEGLLDSASKEMGLSMSRDSLYSNLKKMRSAFREKFVYSLHLPLSKREDPLRTFYRTRQGFCEYFASFSTLLLRRMGIPARYATGFAYPEPGSGYWIFYRRNAHAWVEFLDSEGFWNTFDPTPMTARPVGKDATLLERYAERFRSAASLFFHELTEGRWRASLDALGNWTSRLLESLWLRIGLFLILVGLVAWRIVLRLQKIRKDRENISLRILELRKSLKKAESGLRSLGYVREPGETVQKFMQRIPNTPKTASYSKMLRSYCEERWKSV